MIFLCMGSSGPARVDRANEGWGEAGRTRGWMGTLFEPHHDLITFGRLGLLSEDKEEKPPG